MRRVLTSAAALAATLLLPLAAHTPLAQVSAVASAASARVIVKYRVESELTKKQALGANPKAMVQAQALGARIGVALTAGRAISDRAHVVFAQGMNSASLAALIAAERDVEYAVPDERKHIVAAPNDTFYASRPVTGGGTAGGPAVGQWYLKPSATTGTPSSINAEQAWDRTLGDAGIVVAVIDTGLRFDHPDLFGSNVLLGYDMIDADNPPTNTDFSTAVDDNGRDTNASDPGDGLTQGEINANPVFSGCSPSGSSWHGTETLGLIGAKADNSAGIAGLGRGTVKVMPVRVLGKCGGFDSDIVVGMQWAADVYTTTELAALNLPRVPTAAKVLNMSLGGSGTCSQPYIDAMTRITAAQVVVVASAGNSTGHSVSNPANCPGVIAVSGLRHVGSKVGFSDLGPEIAISAPGGNCINAAANTACLYPIITTSNAGSIAPVLGGTYTDSFVAPSLGTSFSAPLVSGTVALMLSVNPALTPAQVKATLQATARAFPTTGGTVNITVTTATPKATLPVAVAATEPLQCVAPTSSDQLECYCTTATCGAGMLDAHAAVLAAAGGAATPPATVARRVVVYAWALVDGGGIVTALTNANTASASATPTGPGTFIVNLTTTDDLGTVATTDPTTITVGAAPIVTPPVSGGGALGAGWLLLLLTAVLALAAVSRFERGRLRLLSGLVARDARRR